MLQQKLMCQCYQKSNEKMIRGVNFKFSIKNIQAYG